MKKASIIIGILIIACIMVFIVVKKDTSNETKGKNNIVSSDSEQGKIEEFVEQLKEQGITLSNQIEVTSEKIIISMGDASQRWKMPTLRTHL